MEEELSKIIEELKEVLEENDMEVSDKIIFEQAIKIYISKEKSFKKEKAVENLPKMASEKQINFLKSAQNFLIFPTRKMYHTTSMNPRKD